jgi:hypothetical protein
MAGDHVLVETKLAAGAQHAADLGQCDSLVRHRAQDERHDRSVKLAVYSGQRLGGAGHHRNRHRSVLGCALGQPEQARLGLDSEDLVDAVGVVRKVQPVAGADLDHAAFEAGEQSAAMLGGAALLGGATDVRIDAGEDRMAVGRGHLLIRGIEMAFESASGNSRAAG